MTLEGQDDSVLASFPGPSQLSAACSSIFVSAQGEPGNEAIKIVYTCTTVYSQTKMPKHLTASQMPDYLLVMQISKMPGLDGKASDHWNMFLTITIHTCNLPANDGQLHQ